MIGRIVTFYSYKGGTGRTMALANAGSILAANGKRVLLIDWDLEAPGLHRYFAPFLPDPELESTRGLIDILWEYTELVLTDRSRWPVGIESPLDVVDPQRHAIPIDLPLGGNAGVLHFLGAGQQTPSYSTRVQHFDWYAFYERLGGMDCLTAMRRRLLEQYDYVLIDSRTGLNDTAGICTVQMPDMVVLCFTYNHQSIEGIESVANSIRSQVQTRPVTLLPVAMRVEKGIASLVEPARAYARRILNHHLPEEWDPRRREDYWATCEIGYYPEHAFQESLAFIHEPAKRRGTLLEDLQWLTSELQDGVQTKIPQFERLERDRYQRLFALERTLSETAAKVEVATFDVFISYASRDRATVRRLAEQLQAKGVRCWFDAWELRPGMSITEAVPEALSNSNTVAVVIGPNSPGPWQSEEQAALLQQFTRSGRPVIPVWLDNANRAVQPTFLRNRNGIQFSGSPKDVKEIDELIRAIRGGSNDRDIRVFLAYSSPDKWRVRPLYDRLRQEGLRPWLDDTDLLPGQAWEHEVKRAIQKSHVVVVCLSRSSVTKTGSLQKEIKYALEMADSSPSGSIVIVPARLEDCEVPERLSRWQWVDLFEKSGIQKLVSSLVAIKRSAGSLPE